MPYKTALSYLSQKTSVIELQHENGARVAVCPQWTGRVMTSCCDGFDSTSFGFINTNEIDNADDGGGIRHFGGEDIWKITPADIPFEVENDSSDEVEMKAIATVPAADGKMSRFRLNRTVSFLQNEDIQDIFGTVVAQAVLQQEVVSACFMSHNTVRSFTETAVSGRMRGILNATPHCAVIVPVFDMPEHSEKFPYRLDFMGSSPHHRIRHLPNTLLFAADGEGRCQLSIRRDGTSSIFGSLEFRGGFLTLWAFTVPNILNFAQSEPSSPFYADTGTASIKPGTVPVQDAANFIRFGNSGPSKFTAPLPASKYYEVNSFSPAQDIEPGKTLTYQHFTVHINANNEILDNIVQSLFGISHQQFFDKMSL